MTLKKSLTGIGRYVMLMGRVLTRPDRLRMFRRQYITEMYQLGYNSVGIVLIISFFSLLQFVILMFLSEYVGRILTEIRDRGKYAIVFERNSLTMINQDRINVLEESDSSEVNLVQTGRDR